MRVSQGSIACFLANLMSFTQKLKTFGVHERTRILCDYNERLNKRNMYPTAFKVVAKSTLLMITRIYVHRR
jgi:hypothetical protein